jgi:hypothetical protein
MLRFRLTSIRVVIATAIALTFALPAAGELIELHYLVYPDTMLDFPRPFVGVEAAAFGTGREDYTNDRMTIHLPMTRVFWESDTGDFYREHEGAGLFFYNEVSEVFLSDLVLNDAEGNISARISGFGELSVPVFCYGGHLDRRFSICGGLLDVFINQFGVNREDIDGVIVSSIRSGGGEGSGSLPEPGTWGLLTVGLGGGLLLRRRSGARKCR